MTSLHKYNLFIEAPIIGFCFNIFIFLHIYI